MTAPRAALAEFPPPRATSYRTVWGQGLRIGLSTLRSEPLLGLKRIFLPMSYWRAAESAYLLAQLQMPRGARVLDVGSPKEIAAILARARGLEVVATDIQPSAVALSARYAVAQRIEGVGPGRIHSEVQDARQLTYPDAGFDAAFAVSVLEHIPADGDSAAIRELVRVVRPGGRVVVTTPYAPSYRETFVDRPVYERAQLTSEPVFFERHYDETTLRSRLVEPSGARLRDLQIWGEWGIPMERILGRLGLLRVPLSPFETLLAAACLRPAGERIPVRPMAAFFTLRKE